MNIFLWVLVSLIISEFTGYWLHRLLHSDKIHWLSKAHMIHHLVLYGPKTGLRSKVYRDATKGRFGVMGVGGEWILPIAALLVIYSLVFWLLGLSTTYIVVFDAIALLWGNVSFNYIHDGFHLENFWMIKNGWLKKWFLFARHLHDIHHLKISDRGLMDTNFGIGFWLMDIIFGTYARQMATFNERGFEASKKRYSYIHGEADKTLKD